MPDQTANTALEHRLTVAEILGLLVAEGLVVQADAEALIKESRLKRLVAHPLTIIADQKWKSLQPPHRQLTLDDLGEWLAARVGLEYYHIDPLKIDFTAVTDVMSSAYATRFGILPVQVNATEVVIATTEPYLRDWEKEIRPKENPPGNCQPGRCRTVSGRVLQSCAFGQEGHTTGRAKFGSVFFRATCRTGANQPPVRRQRPAHRQYRRLALAVRL